MERAPGAAVETDGALHHLTIDTSLVNGNAINQASDIPRLVPQNDDNTVEAEAAEDMLTIKCPKNHSDRNPRIRAMSDSERALYNKQTGMRIPVQRHIGPVRPQLSPPLSESGSFDPHNPYSTSAHVSSTGSPPNTGLPDSPQSSSGAFIPGRRNSRGLQISVQHNSPSKLTHAQTLPIPPFHRSPNEVGRSASYSYGATIHDRHHQRTPTFVDASSYEDLPNSPAKLGFAAKTVPTPNPDDEGQEIGSYVIGRQLGVGGFSVVKEAITFEDGKQIKHAVKIVRKRASHDEAGSEAVQIHFEHEITVWKCLSSRYILPLLDVIDTSYATWAFTLLFTGGTLFDLFRSHRQGLPPTLALKYAFQLASALRYLHEDARVIHRDVKLENCVLDRPASEGGNLRLCDFGLADFLPGDDTPSPRQQFAKPGGHAQGHQAKHRIRPEDMIAGGSLAYAAPEQINSLTPLLDTAIDMWSYGIVLHAITVGELPFHDPFPPKLQLMIIKGRWNTERCAARVDSEICEIIMNCLQMEPGSRWTSREVLQSQWLSLYSEDQSSDSTCIEDF